MKLIEIHPIPGTADGRLHPGREANAGGKVASVDPLSQDRSRGNELWLGRVTQKDPESMRQQNPQHTSQPHPHPLSPIPLCRHNTCSQHLHFSSCCGCCRSKCQGTKPETVELKPWLGAPFLNTSKFGGPQVPPIPKGPRTGSHILAASQVKLNFIVKSGCAASTRPISRC